MVTTGNAGLRLHVQAGETISGLHGVPLLREPLHKVLLGNGEQPFAPLSNTPPYLRRALLIRVVVGVVFVALSVGV